MVSTNDQASTPSQTHDEVLRVGVIGTGHLGRIHAKLLASVPGAVLAGVSDPDEMGRGRVTQEHGGIAVSHHDALLPHIDAAIVASPTGTHAQVVGDLLDAGKHVLCEKPLTIDPTDARRLAMTAAARRLVLQVGHVERFNPAFIAASEIARDAKYVEAVRASSFPGRCLDVGVVMDLMIHDLDLIRSLTDAPVQSVDASGVSVVSAHEDIAEARITFGCGLVANVKASRINVEAERSMQIFSANGLASIDFQTPSLTTVSTSDQLRDRSFDLDFETDDPLGYRDQLFAEHLRVQTQTLTPRNAILDEQTDFVVSIASGGCPVVSGTAGADAVELADQVVSAIAKRQWSIDPKHVGADVGRVAAGRVTGSEIAVGPRKAA